MTLKHAYAGMVIALCILLAVPQAGFAAVSPEEAEKLKTTLTPMGAERAGNKEGTIPAWEGGYKTVPPGYKTGDIRPDPFANEKPLFSITSQNVNQYADKLSEGNRALFKKYPSYRIDVYPTHRTAAAPDWVYNNTFQNATRAKTKNNGLSIEGAYGGPAFPIPKNGFEAMWNHLLAWEGEETQIQFRAYTTTPNGKHVMVTEATTYRGYPYYRKNGSLKTFNGYYKYTRNNQNAPPFKAGEAILGWDPVDQYGVGRQAWQYLSGQRRVRRAPTVQYDTPNFVVSGFANFDEIGVFFGALDRYDWKLLEKKEMYIPYNNNRFLQRKISEVLGEHYPNPDYVRWELHRVWVVEATLHSGKRHVVPKRRFYLDEDTWLAVLGEGWDGQGKLWKSYYSLPFILMESPSVSGFMYGVYDLQTGAWLIDNMMNERPFQLKLVPPSPEGFWSPEALAGSGVR